jgi:hypothetical protein
MTLFLLLSSPLWLLLRSQSLLAVPLCSLVLPMAKALVHRLAQTLLVPVRHLVKLLLVCLLLSLSHFLHLQHLEAKGVNPKACRHFTAQIPRLSSFLPALSPLLAVLEVLRSLLQSTPLLLTRLPRRGCQFLLLPSAAQECPVRAPRLFQVAVPLEVREVDLARSPSRPRLSLSLSGQAQAPFLLAPFHQLVVMHHPTLAKVDHQEHLRHPTVPKVLRDHQRSSPTRCRLGVAPASPAPSL